VRRVAIIASASGNGKTTVGRRLAKQLEPILASGGWVIDWNGNKESLKGIFWGRESLFGYALTEQRLRPRDWPRELARYPVVRLRSQAEVEACLEAPALGPRG